MVITSFSSYLPLVARDGPGVLKTLVARAAPYDPSSMLFFFDVGLLIIFVLFVFAEIPRIVARFSNFSEWGAGFILVGGSSKQKPPRPSHTRQFSNGFTDDASTISPQSTRIEKISLLYQPSHVPTWASLTFPFSKLITVSWFPGFTNGQLIMWILYFAVLIFLGFFVNNPITGPARFGWIAASQIPIVIIFGTKNNIPGWFLGKGYEKLNYLHRWGGILLAVAANTHALSNIYMVVTARSTGQLTALPWVARPGIAALVGVDLLAFFSIPYVRKHMYELFLFTHIAGSLILPIAVCIHMRGAIPYVIAAAVGFFLDHFFRVVKTRFATANVRVIPELGVTHITVPTIKRGWRAGQHVRLRVLSFEMGIAGWVQQHPFTIASVSDSTSGAGAGQGLVLICKRAGNWTNKLYEAAAKPSALREDMADGLPPARKLRVMVEGPYGGTGHTVLNSYTSMMIVTGGSGITFGLSTIEDAIQKASEGKTRVRFAKLIWIIQSRASLAPMISTLNALIFDSLSVGNFELSISIFYTKALPLRSPDASDPLEALHQSIEVLPGRPSFSLQLKNVIEHTMLVTNPTGIILGVCGPEGLSASVRDASDAVDRHRRNTVGGIEIHEETFGW